MVSSVYNYKVLKKIEPTAAALDADEDGQVDKGEGVVITRCGDRFLVIAEDDCFTVQSNRVLYIPKNHVRIPHAVQIASDETVSSLLEKVRQTSHLAALAAQQPPEKAQSFLKDVRSHEVFRSFARVLSEEMPSIRDRGAFTALYVASGSHIAPLETFFDLIDQGAVTKKSELIMTEIDASTTGLLIDNITYLAENGIIDSYEIGEKTKYKDDGSSYERPIRVFYKGVEINIVSAVNMSGDDFYRIEYLKRADAVILHDVDVGRLAEAELLSKIIKDQRENQLNQVILVENGNDVLVDPVEGRDLTFLNHVTIWEAYGHRGRCENCVSLHEGGFSGTKSAIVILPRQPLLEGLTPNEVDVVIRFATLGSSTSSRDNRLADINSGLCLESIIGAVSLPPAYSDYHERLIDIIKKWDGLPNDVLSKKQKDLLWMHLMFYLYQDSPFVRKEDDEHDFYFQIFYEQRSDIFLRMRRTFHAYREFRKLSRGAHRDVELFLKGRKPRRLYTGKLLEIIRNITLELDKSQ